MSLIAQFLAIDRIRLDLAASTRRQVFEDLARLCAEPSGIAAPRILDSLEARERLGSTGLGQGIAFPHARLKGLQHPCAAFARLRPPIPCGAPDGKPVSEMLMLLVPERATEFHLQLLADAAQLFGDRRFRDHIRAQTDAGAVLQAFTDWNGSGA